MCGVAVNDFGENTSIGLNKLLDLYNVGVNISGPVVDVMVQLTLAVDKLAC